MAKQKQETTALTTPTSLEIQVSEENKKRQILAAYVQQNMKEGTDFYTLKIGGRETKPSLSKPGSEKVLSLFHWRAEFSKDDETWEMLGRPAGVLCYVCKLYTVKDSVLVGEGRGARDAKKDGNDVNKAIKMAEKSAQIDAILRTGGLSDLFTQDVEDMQQEPEKVRYEVPKATPAPVEVDPRSKEIIKELLAKLGENPTTLPAAKAAVKRITGEAWILNTNEEIIINMLQTRVDNQDNLAAFDRAIDGDVIE